MEYEGCRNFRERIVLSILSGKKVKLHKIRENDDSPGLHDFEANFLRLIDRLTDGTHIEINESGTTMRLRPGVGIGAKKVQHDCGKTKSIGWFIEGIIPLVIFSKENVNIEFTGITNDPYDLSVDIIRGVTIPLISRFGIDGLTVEIKSRGFAPNGGGIVHVSCKPVRELYPIYFIDVGKVLKIRGNAISSKISPAVLSRVVEGARSILTPFAKDLFIHTNNFSSKDGGNSPGFTISLVAESDSGVLTSVERTAEKGELPEQVGKECAILLCEEIRQGGITDSSHQALLLQLMVLTPEDVSKVRLGYLSEHSMDVLRLLYDAFGVMFKLKEDVEEGGDVNDHNTILASCNGFGYQNYARKVR